MKKTLIALAALAATGVSFAQVTLYGTVDATLAVGNGNVANKTQLTNSGLSSSELGFKAVEDLGGGMKAGFIMAAGLNNDNGTGSSLSTNNQASGNTTGNGLIFNRRSYLQLMGNFGEIRLGRDYTPAFWQEAVYDTFGINGVGTSRAFLGGAAYTGSVAVRASNTIAYLTPAMGGFSLWAQTYMGENASNAVDTGTGNSVRLSYDAGPLSVGLGWGQTKQAQNVDAAVSNLGLSYNFGAAAINGYVQKSTMTGVNDINGYLVGVTVPFGSAAVRASYSNTDNSVASTNQFALGFIYNLSKLTAFYGTFATVENKGGASQALNGATGAANQGSTGYDFGLKKSF
ncbi:MAG: porin [bacterium]